MPALCGQAGHIVEGRKRKGRWHHPDGSTRGHEQRLIILTAIVPSADSATRTFMIALAVLEVAIVTHAGASKHRRSEDSG
jgi:hypothetical protein